MMPTTLPEGSAGIGGSVLALMPRYGMQSNLPVPSRLDLAGNISENWKKQKQVWDSFEITSCLNQQENKYCVATFITCIGAEDLEVHNEQSSGVDGGAIPQAKQMSFTGNTASKTESKSLKSFDTYLMALRTLTKTCTFSLLTDELICDRSVCGTCDTGTRKKLLQEPKVTLQKCINVCRSAETTVSQMKVMIGKEEVNVHYSKEKKDSKDKRIPKLINCKYCGRKHER